MPGTPVQSTLLVARGLPSPNADGNTPQASPRAGRYGEQMVLNPIPKSHLLADEGSYFVLTTPTPGTGIATIAALTSVVDTSPFILMKNNWASADPRAKRIYLDYIKVICTAAGTGGTSIRYAVKVDIAGANRYTSGSGLATAPVSAVNTNGDDSTASSAQFYAGALVAAAANGARLVANGIFRTVIPVVGDSYILNFGGMDGGAANATLNGTNPVSQVAAAPPVIISPQGWLQFHLALASQSAASSWEIEMGYWER